jgi:hypothetical protein
LPSIQNKDVERSEDPAEERDWELPDEDRGIYEIIAERDDERNFIGLAKLLQLASKLEDLELHQYRLDGDVPTHHKITFERIAEMGTLPNLKRIELRGLYVREEHLLALLKRTGVRKLSMYYLFLSSGTFRAVFDYCTSDAARMEELYFDELFEGRLVAYLRVYFDGSSYEPGRFLFRPLVGSGPGGSQTLVRIGADVKRHISYRSAEGHGIEFPAVMEYRRQQCREYGPPACHLTAQGPPCPYPCIYSHHRTFFSF